MSAWLEQWWSSGAAGWFMLGFGSAAICVAVLDALRRRGGR